MCDDLTRADEMTAGRLNRRDFGAVLAAAALSACASATQAEGGGLSEAMVEFPGGEGLGDGFFVHPLRGRHPAIVIWPDVVGLREAYKVMARRLAASGFAVLVVNQYYRGARAPLFEQFGAGRTAEGEARVRPLAAALGPQAVAADSAAQVAWLDRHPAVDTRRRIGIAGYCQGGQFALRGAAASPGRVGAVAAFHAGGLVTEAAESAHLLLPNTRAELVVGVARNDFARAPAATATFRGAVKVAGVKADIEVYDADHGWCVLDHPAYVAAEAERAWGKMTALFAKL